MKQSNDRFEQNDFSLLFETKIISESENEIRKNRAENNEEDQNRGKGRRKRV